MKSSKSALLHHLESKVLTSDPSSVDITIIAEMFFMHVHINLPTTFDGVARYLLSQIMRFDGKVVHFVCDKWITPSIKDNKRQSRSELASSYCIKGPSQKRPTNWLEALTFNTKFKESLIKFLVDRWEEDIFASVFKDKIMYANFDNTC